MIQWKCESCDEIFLTTTDCGMIPTCPNCESTVIVELEATNGWQSVDDPPKKDGNYWCYICDEKDSYGYQMETEFTLEDGFNIHYAFVMAWRELPSEPDV